MQYCEDQRRMHKLSEEVEGLRHELHILHSQQQQQMNADLESQQTVSKFMMASLTLYFRKDILSHILLPQTELSQPLWLFQLLMVSLDPLRGITA